MLGLVQGRNGEGRRERWGGKTHPVHPRPNQTGHIGTGRRRLDPAIVGDNYSVNAYFNGFFCVLRARIDSQRHVPPGNREKGEWGVGTNARAKNRRGRQREGEERTAKIPILSRILTSHSQKHLLA